MNKSNRPKFVLGGWYWPDGSFSPEDFERNPEPLGQSGTVWAEIDGTAWALVSDDDITPSHVINK